MLTPKPYRDSRNWLVLLAIWGLAIALDGVWLWLDRAIPSWDPADHLIGSLNYAWMVGNAQWTAPDWWQGIWTLTSKYPPLLYLSTAPIINLLGRQPDVAVLVNAGFTGLLLVAVYGLGRHLFNAEVGLWSAGLVLLFPRLYTVRTEYFMDYPLVALVALAVLALTCWRDAKRRPSQWAWSFGFGLSFGLALLMKQSALFFLAVPMLWVGAIALWKREWERLVQLLVAAGVTLWMTLPWVTTNWIFQLSAGVNSNVRSAIAEGDPPLHTLDAWIYYLRDLSAAVSLPLLVVPLVGLGLAVSGLFSSFRDRTPGQVAGRNRAALRWLAVCFGGAYLLWSAIFNKDHRYVMPYLPMLAVILGYGLTRYRSRVVRFGTVGLCVGLLLLNLFPLGGAIAAPLTGFLTPDAQRFPDRSPVLPLQAVVDEIIQAEPYQVVNLGVLHSTATLNQHNLTYYGNRRDFRVYSRRVGNDDDHLEQDVRSLSWFLVQSGRASSDSRKTRQQRAQMRRMIRRSGEFQRQQVWALPDGTDLQLYRRISPPVEVNPLTAIPSSPAPVQLTRVTVPPQVPPGQPVPVTYEWQGNWQALHQGLVLLSWERRDRPTAANSQPTGWIHDHSIGLGTLHPQPIQANQTVVAAETVDPAQPFQVIERTAMLPPSDAAPGVYTLQATYLNSTTGEAENLPVPAIALTVNPQANPTPAPVLDWGTQLRSLAPTLAEGREALDPLFEQIARLNLYDPIQNYLVQMETALAYRLQQQPEHLDYAYGLALARGLQRKVDPAIAALQQVIQLDPQNPNPYAYLAVVNLYAFRPGAAQTALAPALTLQPNSPELRGIRAIAALMQGNLWQAWVDGRFALQSAPDE